MPHNELSARPFALNGRGALLNVFRVSFWLESTRKTAAIALRAMARQGG